MTLDHSKEGVPMEFHEYAKMFPLMEGDEFDGLVEDIRSHGLLEPIVTLKDQILDGRNRYRACQKANVAARFEKYQGNGARDYVISKNLKRRHLTAGQLGFIALDLEKEFVAEAAKRKKGGKPVSDAAKGRAAGQAAKVMGVSERTVNQCKYVNEYCQRRSCSLAAQVRQGRMSARAAEENIRMHQARESSARQEAKKDKKTRQTRPREVKEYLDAVRTFCDALKTAKKVAVFGKFSPEAMRFTKRWHDTVRGLLSEVDTAFDHALKQSKKKGAS